MPDEDSDGVLAGDIVINETCVRFSDRVGSVVSNAQIAVLARTAERLGKNAVHDRYPSSPILSDFVESMYDRDCYGQPNRRNEHGVPEAYITASLLTQMRMRSRE